MNNQPNPLSDILEHHQQIDRNINRILWIFLPILALTLSMIIANWNIWSTIGTFVMLLICLIGVGIKRWSLFVVLAACSLYCFIDNYWSYQQQFNSVGLKRQWWCSLLFISIISLSRPAVERYLKRTPTA